MRLDKYLKVSRIIKRRTVAKEAAEKEKIEVNGKVAKPSTTLKEGDVLTLYLGAKIITVRVKSLVLLKDELMYELLKEEKRP
ncbi:MAG: RNA-binding S4 domain-containing protein [Acholeplasma sp.]|jgi:ribosomal 50S subunit-recycling heat shock protein|nr:MAG: RNA-binding S4 domain-containing protein [Acholeplasma sp.]